MAIETIAHVCFYLIAIAFSITSVFHVLLNGFFQQNQSESRMAFFLHKICFLAFAFMTLIYAISVFKSMFADLLFVFVACVLIHSGRIALDFFDGSDSRRIGVLARHAIDAAANFITIIFVVAVAVHQDQALGWPALFLSVCLIGKELVYRLWLDLRPRNQNDRKTAHGGSGARSPDHFRTYHAYMNSTKSLSYAIAGFALIYCSIATLHPEYRVTIFPDSINSNLFIQSMAFSIKNMPLTLAGHSPLPLMIIIIIEFFVCAFFLWTYRTVPVTRS